MQAGQVESRTEGIQDKKKFMTEGGKIGRSMDSMDAGQYGSK